MAKYMLQHLFFGLVLFLTVITVSAQQEKYALVIGVKSYQNVQPLRNSLNDAQDMAAMLKTKGFQVVEMYDPQTKREMQEGIRRYFALVKDRPEAAGLVFYSGHGIQLKGLNYLIPVRANPQIEADLDDQCLNMDYVMRAIEQAGNGLNIFVLDACRNNPFQGFNRTSDKGLSVVDTPKGSYIVYATKPGSVASDGKGRNGLFTSKLLKYINKPGLNIEQVFKQVAREVAEESDDTQRPWIASDYTGDFFFTPEVNGIDNTSSELQTIQQPTPDYGYGPKDSPIVTVGSQIWMGKNLNVDHFANGDPILEAKSFEDWKKAGDEKRPAWCYFNNDPANGNFYGRLYNWYAVNDPRGLAPKGWHVANNTDWDQIINYLGGSITSGAALKSTNGWENNGSGTNSSGIACLPGGFRYTDGVFSGLGKVSDLWSSSEYNANDAWYHLLHYLNGEINMGKFDKSFGLSVRCLKD